MPINDHRILDYRPPQPRGPWKLPGWFGWLVELISGAGAGYVMSFSGSGWFCYGILVGFTVAGLSATFGGKRKLAFGLLGNGVTLLTAIVTGTINTWRSGEPISASDFFGFCWS